MKTATKTTTPKATPKVPPHPSPMVAKMIAIEWWVWVVSTLEDIAWRARELAKEADREGSPLEGVFNTVALRDLSNMIDDDIFNAFTHHPPQLASVPNPLAGFPARD